MKMFNQLHIFKKFIKSHKKYEYIIMLLRGLIYQMIHLRYLGIILMGRGSKIQGLRNIRIKGAICLADYSEIDARFCRKLLIGENFSIGKFTIFRASGSSTVCPGIHIGSNVSFGAFCYIGGGFGLDIKDNLLFGPYISIHPENHNYTNEPIKSKGISGVGIKIGSNSWFGAKCTILDGAEIEDNVIFGASSLITKGRYVSNSIYFGIPAKLQKNIHDTK